MWRTLTPKDFCPMSPYTCTNTHTQIHTPPTYCWVSCCSCASWCRRLRAFSCLRWSFHDFEATLRANSLCLSSFSLCITWKLRGIKGGTEKACGEQGEARKAQEWDKEERREIEKLVLESSLQAAVFQTIHISQQRLQMFSSAAHVQLTPFSLEESFSPSTRSLRANTTQLVNSRLQAQLRCVTWDIYWWWCSCHWNF